MSRWRGIIVQMKARGFPLHAKQGFPPPKKMAPEYLN